MLVVSLGRIVMPLVVCISIIHIGETNSLYSTKFGKLISVRIIFGPDVKHILTRSAISIIAWVCHEICALSETGVLPVWALKPQKPGHIGPGTAIHFDLDMEWI